eukprot:5935553-Pleurochrysis_carterae.AAC.1
MKIRSSSRWNVRLCRTPEIGPPLPESARSALTTAFPEPQYDLDTIFRRFVANSLLPHVRFPDEYFASAVLYCSTPPEPYNSRHVAWIEIWMDDHRGVIPVRVLEANARAAPESGIIGSDSR